MVRPVSEQIAEFISLPDHEGHLAYQHAVLEDLRLLYDLIGVSLPLDVVGAQHTFSQCKTSRVLCLSCQDEEANWLSLTRRWLWTTMVSTSVACQELVASCCFRSMWLAEWRFRRLVSHKLAKQAMRKGPDAYMNQSTSSY